MKASQHNSGGFGEAVARPGFAAAAVLLAIMGCTEPAGVVAPEPDFARRPSRDYVPSALVNRRALERVSINGRGQVALNTVRFTDTGTDAIPWVLDEKGRYSCRGTKEKLCQLPTLGSGWAQGNAISDRGVVVGSSIGPDGRQHAVVWRDGTITDLGTGDGLHASADGINIHEVIVGSVVDHDGTRRASVWQEGRMRLLQTADGFESYAAAINDRGQIVGRVYQGGNSQGVLWEDGALTSLGDFYPRDINNRGEVAGSSGRGAFIWQKGHIYELGSRQRTYPRPQAINDLGQVVGILETDDPPYCWQAVIWDQGLLSNLGTLGGCEGAAMDINKRGQVVGWSAWPGEFKVPTLWSR